MAFIDDLKTKTIKGANSTYWGNIREGWRSLKGGLILSFMHFRKGWIKKRRPSVGAADKSYFDHKEGVFTNYYPHESLPVPDNGRYRLHNEIDDCIVCDKCAKVCPVDCIEIEAIKEPTGEIRKTSDGSSVRLHPAKFDIDMAKCCYCGLCTTVCPTECLTMTKAFDYSELDIRDMVYEFSYMSDSDVTNKKKELDDFMEAKNAAKAVKVPESSSNDVDSKPKVVIPGAKKPVVSKPKVVIPGAKKPVVAKPKVVIPGTAKPKVVIPKPKTQGEESIKPKNAVLMPKIGVKKEKVNEDKPEKKALKPVMKPKIPPKKNPES